MRPGRCATLLPVLARLPQPLALLEVGASAGLCLLPDRYGYDYGHRQLAPASPDAPVFPCRANPATPLPVAHPRVVWRLGLDLHPVDVADAAHRAWLETLVWPEQSDRLHRLRGALAVARRDPPRVAQGDLLTDLHGLRATRTEGCDACRLPLGGARLRDGCRLARRVRADRARAWCRVGQQRSAWCVSVNPASASRARGRAVHFCLRSMECRWRGPTRTAVGSNGLARRRDRNEACRGRWRWSPADRAASAGRPRSHSPRKAPTSRSAISTMARRPRKPRTRSARWAGARCIDRSMWSISPPAGRSPQAVTAAFGPIDILFNNAGMNIRKRFEDYTEADYDRILDVHMKGMFFMAQAVYPAMAARGRGCIINVASQRGLKGAVNSTPYCAAKAAIIGFTRALACEATPKGVRVNAIAPGPIVTDLTATMAPADRQAFIDALPVHRFGRPEEIAATALLLAGPDGGFYVGATLSPNGGDVMY